MARRGRTRRAPPRRQRQVEDYRHEEATRPNNPPAGLAWQDTEKPPKRQFEYDPHLDPQLVWAGKAERASFEVEAPSIHVHERLSTEAIIRAVQKEPAQPALFGDEQLDRSKAVEFYKHEQDWVNRLVLGDSLVVMTSLLEKERLGGQVQMIYLDPPYGINYNSNFQARISDRTPRETSDEALTREPEQIQAYRDTWELGVHSYLTYLRDRLLLCRELLSDTGSVFVQIGPDNVHLVRSLLDEVFGRENACTMIVATTTTGLGARLLADTHTHLLWYARRRELVKYRDLFTSKAVGSQGAAGYNKLELSDGTRRPMTREEMANPSTLPEGARPYALDNLTSQGFREKTTIPYVFEGREFHPGRNKCWKTTKEGLDRLVEKRRLEVAGNTLTYVRFLEDLPAARLKNVWTDMTRAGFGEKKRYVVETVPKLIARCILMTTDPGDLIVDPTCGSGTTAYVAEQYGRRWITIDTSRVAVALSRERVLTATYPYYELVDENRGVDAGLYYRKIPRVTLGSVAHDQRPEEVALYDQPIVDGSKVRISGPFTFEALSLYSVNPLQEGVPPKPDDPEAAEAQNHVAALLEALRRQGIPVKGRKWPLEIASLEPLASVGALHAEGMYKANASEKRFAVSLGPRFGPITFAQINEAMKESVGYDLIVFAGFAATAEAQEVIAKGTLGARSVALLEANPELLVGDLLKTTTSSQTFRLFSSPDVELLRNGKEVRVKVLGIDTFDASTGEVRSAGQKDIAAWFLDQDYDGIVFHVNQAFFPKTGGWDSVQRALRGTIDADMMEQLESFESLDFEPGEQRKAAVRVVEDSGTLSEILLDL